MKKGNPIFYSTILLTGANFLLRLAGISFQVYLSSRVGAAGIGLLQLILSVSALSFTAGSAGVRTCAMYLSAGELGRNRPGNVHSVLTGCFQYSLFFSGITAAALWWAAPWLCRVWIGDSAATAALRLCALFLPIRCLRGVLTGYFTAAQRVGAMVAVAFLEQGCAMALTFLLLSRWAGADSGALAVIAGSCAADALGFLVLLCLRNRRVRRLRGRPPYGRILRISLPLALADALRSGLNTIEDLIIPRRLALFAGTVNAMADYGMLRGMVFPLLMFPAAILFSLAELLVPEFSRCAARGSKNRIQYLTRRGLRAAMLFGLCSGGMLFVLAGRLGSILYQSGQALHGRPGGRHVQGLGPAERQRQVQYADLFSGRGLPLGSPAPSGAGRVLFQLCRHPPHQLCPEPAASGTGIRHPAGAGENGAGGSRHGGGLYPGGSGRRGWAAGPGRVLSAAAGRAVAAAAGGGPGGPAVAEKPDRGPVLTWMI